MAEPTPPAPEEPDRRDEAEAAADMHTVLRVVSKGLVPIIALFGFYVQFHGDFGPGGGFQAGVIVAVAVMLYALVYGVDAARRAVPPGFVQAGAATGVSLYAGVGVVSLFHGAAFLDYDVLGHGLHGQHIGILLVELGVLFTVASVIVAIFYAFAGRVSDIPEDEW